MGNRLHLDFSIEDARDRKSFLDDYVERPEFKLKPLTEEELETCANYLLWGKDMEGKNSVQKKEVQIKTRYGTWDAKDDESLDALFENPSFNEAQLTNPNSIKLKVPREVFSRQKALETAPESLKETYIELFNQIDKLDLILNYYDLRSGKRKNPPRQELLSKFTEEEQEELEEESRHLSSYKYLKMRHLLVELRRQQFSIKDSYSDQIVRHTIPTIDLPTINISFDTDVEILPLGVYSDNIISSLIFRDTFDPESYTEKELKLISDYLWSKEMTEKTKIDFRELEHVYNVILLYADLEDSSLREDFESQTAPFLKTLKYYSDRAELTEPQEEILTLKIQGKKNQEIADIVNKKYNKMYSANYISTIFRKKIIKQINDAARRHYDIISNIFFPENFKNCSVCGKLLLKDTEYFVRKTRSKDGYSNRCKKCDKADRERKKELKKNE